VSGADPLNLLGIAVPGERLPALTANRLLWKGGIAEATRVGRETAFLSGEPPADAAEGWRIEQALARRSVPPRLRPYLGRTA
jgi:ATP-dependent Lhr-like helicase